MKNDEILEIIKDAYQKQKSIFYIQKILKKQEVELTGLQLLELLKNAYKELGQPFAYDEGTFIVQNYSDLDDLYTANFTEGKYGECRLIVSDRMSLFNQFRMLLIES